MKAIMIRYFKFIFVFLAVTPALMRPQSIPHRDSAANALKPFASASATRLSAAAAQAAAQTVRPLSKEQLLELIQGGVPSQRAIELIHAHGINFEANEDYLRILRRAGGTDQLISELRKISVPMEGITVETDPNAQIFLDGVSQGRADSRGVLVIRAKVGSHALRVAEPGKRNFDQNLTLVDGQPLHIVAPLTGMTGGLLVKGAPGAAVWFDNSFRGNIDGTGQLHLSNLPAGTHTLRASAPGKVDDSRSVVVATGTDIPVEVTLLDRMQINPQDRQNYVWIAAGTFQMGCSPGDADCTSPEKPAHRVTITKPFWIGQTEVPVGAYRHFAHATKTPMPPSAPKSYRNWKSRDLPMVNETWDEASHYCSWAGGRLPTEAEWEFAARGGSTQARYGQLGDIAWFKGNADSQTHPVRRKTPNAYGLFDALGNVWEWVSDWYDPNYYQNSPAEDPTGPSAGQQKVLRGGAWIVDPKLVRVSDRYSLQPTARSDFFGFRCVWDRKPQ